MTYGWKGIGLGDHRDEGYSYRATFKAVEVPKVKYLICAPVVDQESLGACVFFALSYAMEAMQVVQDKIPINPSQLFAYYRYREMYGHVEYDDGAFIRDAIKVFAKDGVCLEEFWPYITANFAKRPPAQAFQEAQKNRIVSYHAINGYEDMIQCLASGYGFVGGISVYESFESMSTERTGVVTMPGPGEKLLGGHAVYFGAGYDLHRGMIKFPNSYGPTWGDQGFGEIPIEYLTNPRLAGDFWTVRG